MGKTYRVSIEVEVSDEKELFYEAKARAEAEGQNAQTVLEILGTPDAVNVEACLITLLDDPAALEDAGSEILESTCECVHCPAL